jgi:hypothetical protein
MELRGIVDLLAFLNHLKSEKIHYRIEHCRPDAIMASFTGVAARIEVDFFEDHIEFSAFKGDESVEDDPQSLMRLISAHWHD